MLYASLRTRVYPGSADAVYNQDLHIVPHALQLANNGLCRAHDRYLASTSVFYAAGIQRFEALFVQDVF